MEIVVFTLFPDMFRGVLGESMFKRSVDQGNVGVRLVNFRDYATDKHHTVDDAPFGGGAGMLLKPEPLFDAVETVRATWADSPGDQFESSTPIVLLTPQGQPFTQLVAARFAKCQRLVLICGHYEGFDERVRQHLVTEEISLGDFVMTGGEIAAMAIMDAVVRLLPGTLGNHVSAEDDSFATGLLEYPQYTRPAEYRGWKVPDVLLSGNHQAIANWRRRQSLYRTWQRRPDLLKQLALTAEETELIRLWESGVPHGVE